MPRLLTTLLAGLLTLALPASAAEPVLLAPVVLAIALIYVLNPVVNRLHGWHLHRLLGTLVGFILLSGFIVAIGFLVAPSISVSR